MEKENQRNGQTQNEEGWNFRERKVQLVTLPELQRTHKENDPVGNPLKGIYHCDLIREIGEIVEGMGLRMQVEEIFAAQNREKNQPGVVLLPKVEEVYGPNAVEAHILRRVFANVRILDLDDEEFTTNLAVAFHQKGIQVGFGNQVRICHNQTILGADRIVSNYGDDKTGLEGIFEQVRQWCANIKEIIIPERERLRRMKEVELEPQNLLVLIGDLTAARVAHDTEYEEIRQQGTYPLNQSQISQFTETLLLTQHRSGRVTLWDVYNAATDLLKAERMEIPNVLPQHLAITEFLNGHFNE